MRDPNSGKLARARTLVQARTSSNNGEAMRREEAVRLSGDQNDLWIGMEDLLLQSNERPIRTSTACTAPPDEGAS